MCCSRKESNYDLLCRWIEVTVTPSCRHSNQTNSETRPAISAMGRAGFSLRGQVGTASADNSAAITSAVKNG